MVNSKVKEFIRLLKKETVDWFSECGGMITHMDKITNIIDKLAGSDLIKQKKEIIK